MVTGAILTAIALATGLLPRDTRMLQACEPRFTRVTRFGTGIPQMS